MSVVNEEAPVREHALLPLEELMARNVVDAASLLDEHVPGWARRIKRPLNIRSIHDCVLGQVFEERPRRLFGLLPGKDVYGNGFSRGLAFFHRRGITPPSFAFSSGEATSYWKVEIEKRG